MGRIGGALCTLAGTIALGGGVLLTAVAPPPGPTVGQAVGAELRERGSYLALLEVCAASGDVGVCEHLAGL